MRFTLKLLLAAAVGWIGADRAVEAGHGRGGCGGCAPACAPACGGDSAGCATAVNCTAAAAGHYEYQDQQTTVMVPQTTMQKRKIQVTQMKQEQHDRTVQVRTLVPHTEMVEKQYTVMVPVQKTKQVTETVNKVEYVDVERDVTVYVPVQKTKTVNYTVYKTVLEAQEQDHTVMQRQLEKVQAVRAVTKCVPTEATRTVTVDRGTWEEKTEMVQCAAPVAANNCGTGAPACVRRGLFHRNRGCNSCGTPCATGCTTGCTTAATGCTTEPSCAAVAPAAPEMVAVTKKVWVAKPVQEEQKYTVYNRVTENVPYEYTVCKMVPVTTKVTVNVPKCVATPMTREVSYTECEAQTKKVMTKVAKCTPTPVTREVTYTVCEAQTKTCQVPVTKCVEKVEDKVIHETVCVPTTVEKEIEVAVCTMVPKTVTKKVCVWVPGAPATAAQGCAAEPTCAAPAPTTVPETAPVPTPPAQQ